jgi:dTDP-4-dehydrorhamnose reductase
VVIEDKHEPTGKHRYLVFGASGLLGSRIFEDLSRDFETFGTFHSSGMAQTEYMRRINLTKPEEMLSVVTEIKPTHIINCIGLTNVEKCELLPEVSWKLNSEIPFRLAKLSSKLNIQFIQISTDHFLSLENSPRSELDFAFGINQYGFTKVFAEKLILSENPKSLILRTNFFGTSKIRFGSLLDFAMESIRSDVPIYGFDDVIFSPVGIGQICQFLKSQNISEATGVLNFASDRPISKYDFMVLVSRAMGMPNAQIFRSSIESSSLTVRRPNYLALDSTRLTRELGFTMPKIDEMLRSEISRIV